MDVPVSISILKEGEIFPLSYIRYFTSLPRRGDHIILRGENHPRPVLFIFHKENISEEFTFSVGLVVGLPLEQSSLFKGLP